MTHDSESHRRPFRRALLITLLYLIVGVAWILGSDHLASLVAGEMAELALFQRVKGLAYIALTGIALYLLIRHAVGELQRNERRIQMGLRARDHLARYLNAIIEAAPVAVFDLTPRLTIHSLWNPAAERIFGFSRDEVVGTAPRLIDDHAMTRVEERRQSVERGEPVQAIEIGLLRKDGSRFPALVAAAPLEGIDPSVTVVIASDVSELKETVTKMRRVLDEREVLIREIHHRVKNNLQIISSLLVMELNRADTEQQDRSGMDRAL